MSQHSLLPDLWPQKPCAGALYRSLPLKVPWKLPGSAHTVIVLRDAGITHFTMCKDGSDEVAHCKINTLNESLLFLVRLTISAEGKKRVYIGDMDLGRAITLMGEPPTNPARTHVNHADGNLCNNTAATLQFVTAALNSFNISKWKDSNGFFGLYSNKQKTTKPTFQVQLLGMKHGTYQSSETAALIYNVVCCNMFADQLVKTPHLLNQVQNKDKRSLTVAILPNRVSIHRVDGIFVLFYEDKIQGGQHKSIQTAHQAAAKLVAGLSAKRAQEEAAWKDKAKTLKITDKDKQNGIAVLLVLSTSN